MKRPSRRRGRSSNVIKINHTAVTEDGWRLHLVRTQSTNPEVGRLRNFPILLVPGLGSSGAYSFDLSPIVSLADWLAERGWDVWTVELRGNGRSDKPSVWGGRSNWWTVDDNVEQDIPAALAYVCMHAGSSAAHCMGHSMGGMVLTGALARNDATAARMRSVTLIGSSCFLEGSWWSAILPAMSAARLLYAVPAGTTLRMYAPLSFTRLGVRLLDVLYFWPTNTDPALARAVLGRNFSAISPGVILQMRSAFEASGLRSSRPGHAPFADPARLAQVHTPVMLICGDKDKMCPPQGAVKQFEMFGSPNKRLRILGPKSGHTSHVGHFDILMGKRVHTESFPELHAWCEENDNCFGLAPIKPLPAPHQPPHLPALHHTEQPAIVAAAASSPLPQAQQGAQHSAGVQEQARSADDDEGQQCDDSRQEQQPKSRKGRQQQHPAARAPRSHYGHSSHTVSLPGMGSVGVHDREPPAVPVQAPVHGVMHVVGDHTHSSPSAPGSAHHPSQHSHHGHRSHTVTLAGMGSVGVADPEPPAVQAPLHGHLHVQSSAVPPHMTPPATTAAPQQQHHHYHHHTQQDSSGSQVQQRDLPQGSGHQQAHQPEQQQQQQQQQVQRSACHSTMHNPTVSPETQAGSRDLGAYVSRVHHSSQPPWAIDLSRLVVVENMQRSRL